MATAPQVVPGDPAQRKPRRSRSPAVARPAYFLVQVTNEQGEPVAFDKKRIKLILVERDLEVVAEMMESERYPHAFYLRGIVPVRRVGQPRATPAAAA